MADLESSKIEVGAWEEPPPGKAASKIEVGAWVEPPTDLGAGKIEICAWLDRVTCAALLAVETSGLLTEGADSPLWVTNLLTGLSSDFDPTLPNIYPTAVFYNVGDILSCWPGNFAGVITREWKRGGVLQSTGLTYTLTSPDFGATLTCEISADAVLVGTATLILPAITYATITRTTSDGANRTTSEPTNRTIYTRIT